MTTTNSTKAEREKEARLQASAAKAAERPPSTDLSHLDDAAGAAAPAKPSHKPLRKLAKPPAVVLDNADVERLVGGRRQLRRMRSTPPAAPAAQDTPPVATPPVAVAAPPWAAAHPKVISPYSLRLPEELHMKLTWLAQHLPNTSMNKLMLDAIAKSAEALLAKHYAPEDDK